MTSSGKRALLAVAILFVILAGVAFYFIHGFGTNPVLAPGAPPDLFSLLPPDAPLIVFGDVDAVKNSAAFAKGSVLFSPGVAEDPVYQDFVRETGFDYSRDLDRFVIAAWPNEDSHSTVAAERIRLIAIADGRFEHEKIDNYARRVGRVSNSGGAVVYETPSAIPGQGISFTFLGPGRIAFAQAMSLDPVLHPAQVSQQDPSTRERIARVSGAQFFAVARTDDLPKAIGAHELQSGQLNRLLKSIRNITVSGRPDGANFILAAEADCDSLSNALQLATLLDTLRWLGRAALADPNTRAQMHANDAALLDSLLRVAAVSHDGRSVRLRLELTPQILQGSAKSR
jgi:hypothetical protein